MERTDTPTALAVLYLPDLDVELVQAMAKHWLVIVDQQAENVKIELHPKTPI